ncbi:hypothetical protein BDV26DRAFT_255829 [Aspergillus bertholletiae]|uniref:Uncharacterized protein n=1 Tax=Aspergillus bertholletiae TaxID=1226010 RepID=A0A5N7BHC2_9EURO|nr:hypothetical protein BDV26DRAFT_255829 [Aspergillus bertholletiae]
MQLKGQFAIKPCNITPVMHLHLAHESSVFHEPLQPHRTPVRVVAPSLVLVTLAWLFALLRGLKTTGHRPNHCDQHGAQRKVESGPPNNRSKYRATRVADGLKGQQILD